MAYLIWQVKQLSVRWQLKLCPTSKIECLIFKIEKSQMADAMEMMILSILSPALYCEWQISTVEQAMITTCVFSGMMLSATIWGKICDRFGRRTVRCFPAIPFSMQKRFQFFHLSENFVPKLWAKIFWRQNCLARNAIPKNFAHFLKS